MNKISLSTIIYGTLSTFSIYLTNTVIFNSTLLFSNSYFYFITFLAFITLLFLDIKKRDQYKYHLHKIIVISLSLIIIVVFFAVPRIYLRHSYNPLYDLSDTGVKTKIAADFLIRGENPYSLDFKNTLYKNFNYPEEYQGEYKHYVYLPFFLIANSYFQTITYHYFNFSDPLILLLFFYFACLIILYIIPKDKEKKIIVVTLAAFNPYLLLTLIHGQNDIFTLFFIILSVFLLSKEKYFWSSIFLGAACGAKQYAWILIPFYLYFLYSQTDKESVKEKILFAGKKIIPGLAVFFAFILPFLLWAGPDFIEDTILFCTGGMPNSFPVSGSGLSGILVGKSFIKSLNGASITYIIQIAVCLPLFIWLIKILKKNKEISTLLFAYTLFTFVFLITNRFFNENFIVVFGVLALAIYAFQNNEKSDTLKI